MATVFKVKKYIGILEDIQNYIIANSDKVSDFNEGDVLASQIEAFSRQIEQLYIKTKTSYEKYFPDIPFHVFDFEKKVGQYSGGSVVFSRLVAEATVVTIAIGTIIATTEGFEYTTTSVGTIGSGNTDSNSVTILANVIGKDSNVPASTITTIISTVADVDTVTNAAATTAGLDEENNQDYLIRFQDFIRGLGKSNKSGIITGALSVTGIRTASIVEHFPPLSNIYNFTVYVEDGSGSVSSALVTEVTEVLEGTGTEADPGYKAVGTNLRVISPTKVDISVTCEITDDGRIGLPAMQYNAEVAIENYINNLAIGDDVIINEIRSAIMEVDGVYDIDLTVPASNTSISTAQIAKTLTLTITFA